MKRYATRTALAALLLLPLAVWTLASCSGGSRRAPDGVRVIELWHGFNAEETALFRLIVADFQEQWYEEHGEEVEIRLQFVSFGDMFTKLRTAALGQITPDMAFVDSIKVTDLAFGNALVRLDELDGFAERYDSIEEAREEFVGASFDAGIVTRLGERGLFGVPVQSTTVALFWNREIFRRRASDLRAAGLDPNRPPHDWDEFFAYGEVLTDPQRRVHAYGLSASLWFCFPFFNMYQVDFVDYLPDGTAVAAVNTPNGIAALERIRSIALSDIEGGAWRRAALPPDDGFINGNYAMILTGPWNVENFTNAGLDFGIGLIPAPPQEEIDALGLEPADPDLVESLGIQAWSSSNLGGQSGVIMRSCEDRELAYAFLEHFTGEEVQRRWGSSLGQIPVRMAAWENLDMSRYPFMGNFMTQLRTARRIPPIPLYDVLETNIFNPQVDLLLQGRTTSEAMATTMERQMEAQIFARMNRAAETARR